MGETRDFGTLRLRAETQTDFNSWIRCLPNPKTQSSEIESRLSPAHVPRTLRRTLSLPASRLCPRRCQTTPQLHLSEQLQESPIKEGVVDAVVAQAVEGWVDNDEASVPCASAPWPAVPCTSAPCRGGGAASTPSPGGQARNTWTVSAKPSATDTDEVNPGSDALLSSPRHSTPSLASVLSFPRHSSSSLASVPSFPRHSSSSLASVPSFPPAELFARLGAIGCSEGYAQARPEASPRSARVGHRLGSAATCSLKEQRGHLGSTRIGD